MSNKKNLKALLSPFFHDSIIVYIEDLIDLHKVEFILSKPRKTKLGGSHKSRHQDYNAQGLDSKLHHFLH